MALPAITTGDVGIQEHLGSTIPLQLHFKDETGKDVLLSDYFGTTPVLLNLVYFNCPMLCNLVLDGVVKGVNRLAEPDGGQFQMLAISIDPNDTTVSAAAFKEKHEKELIFKSLGRKWHFLVGDEKTIKALADAVGFQYLYNADTGEFAHTAVTFILSPNGNISRYLYGTDYRPTDIKLSLAEAKEGKSVSSIEKLLLFCYNYDSHSKKYMLAASTLMKASGLVVLLSIMGLVIWLKKNEKQGK